jgi:hypothetical protein
MVNLSAAGADQLTVQVKAVSAGGGNVMLAITEDNLTTKVGSGENGGRTLHHAAVVRELRQLGQIHNGGFEANVPVNRHCLFDSFEEAKLSVERGLFNQGEPGPFRIFAVHTVAQ